MNAAHFHLVINHLPVLLPALGIIGLVWAFVQPSRQVHAAAMVLVLLGAVSSAIASESGDDAEDIVETIPGISHDAIEAHEEAAEAANALAMTLAGCVALVFVVRRMWPKLGRAADALLIVVGIVSTAAMVRTAMLGGEIRHPEIHGVKAPAHTESDH